MDKSQKTRSSSDTLEDLTGYIVRINRAMLDMEKSIQEAHREFNSFISLSGKLLKTLKEKKE